MTTNFHDLYQRYAPDVYRFAYWLCGDSKDAEDITSETFVRAITAQGNLQSETVKGYLLTIARNLAFKRAKSAERELTLNEQTHDPHPDPASLTETNLELDSVFRILGTLTEIDRTALLLRVQEDLTYEEIAIVLGISVTAIKVKIHRARLKLIAVRAKIEE
jgi:RNA polymerase sigma-70 factor (ECF subfamily)